MKDALIKFLATGAYVGLIARAPGTFGTLWGVPAALAMSAVEWPYQIIIIAVAFVMASYIAGKAEKVLGGKDPSSIVIDEVVGYMAAAFLIPFTATNAILIFLLFRFFDIVKPFPIRQMERRIPGGTGVVADDLVAGIMANLAVRVLLYLLQVI